VGRDHPGKSLLRIRLKLYLYTLSIFLLTCASFVGPVAMERFACSNEAVWTDFNFSLAALFLNLLLLAFFLFAGLRKLALQATSSTEGDDKNVGRFPNSIATILILTFSVCTWFVFGTQISCSDSKRIVTYSFGFASRNDMCGPMCDRWRLIVVA
jgi:hypothetical protein